MKLIVPIIGLFAVFAVASTDGKEDIKVVDLAEDLAKARQDLAKSREDLAKSREETKEIIQRENEKLKAEDDKLRKDADKLREEDKKIKKDAQKIKKENQRLRKQDAKLQREMAEIKKTQRQKDQNNTLELQHFLKDSIRQKDVSSELKKMMKRQIEEYLQVNKICVAGNFGFNVGLSNFPSGQTNAHTVNFGHTFARVPTFSASLSRFRITLTSGTADVDAPMSVKEVTKSSAKLHLFADRQFGYFYVDWIACL